MSNISPQVLEYEFEMFKHPVPVNLPVLVLSTSRSILRDALPVQLPLNATKALPSPDEVRAALAEAERAGQLAAVRSYLAAAAPYDLSDAVRQKLVDEFVQIRQKDPSFGAEEFQTQLTVGLALAHDFNYHVRSACPDLNPDPCVSLLCSWHGLAR